MMEADNAANVGGFAGAVDARTEQGEYENKLTALNPASLGITDMNVYGNSGKPLAPVAAGTRFDATASAEKAASKYGVTIDEVMRDAKTRNRIMRDVLKDAVSEGFLPRELGYRVTGGKNSQMKIAVRVPGDYRNPQFNTWSVSCRDIAGKSGLHDPNHVRIESVPSATGLELRERVRDVALNVFGKYGEGDSDGEWHDWHNPLVDVVGADPQGDYDAYYRFRQFTDDERRELARIWEMTTPEPVRGMIAHCETVHPSKGRKRRYNCSIRGRVVEREPFT